MLLTSANQSNFHVFRSIRHALKFPGLAPTGLVTGTGISLNYTAVTNMNDRTIQGFSTKANPRFKPGQDENLPFYSFFLPYLAYYGESNVAFADAIATAGFDGAETTLSNGNVDLTGYGYSARCRKSDFKRFAGPSLAMNVT